LQIRKWKLTTQALTVFFSFSVNLCSVIRCKNSLSPYGDCKLLRFINKVK
jgi:hypothetical protein